VFIRVRKAFDFQVESTGRQLPLSLFLITYNFHPQYRKNLGKSRKSEASLAQNLRLV